jgi:SAM-dependent methyltransferase
MGSLDRQLGQWADGISDELRFWRHWFATRGGDWPEDFVRRLDPAATLDPRVETCLLELGGRGRVLDVGAGPITKLGYRSEAVECEIMAIDPLAPVYSTLLGEFGFTPPVPTQFGTAEDLMALFPDVRFDLVHCCNALDHSFDPIRGIDQMLRVTRLGGNLLLVHQRNEAERERYAGFHQYNLDVIDGEFLVWNRQERYAPAQLLNSVAECSAWLDGEVVVAKFRKTRDFVDIGAWRETASRLMDVWRASVVALARRGPT